MILFPLMTAWMWLQIFRASARAVSMDTCEPWLSLLHIPIKGGRT
jgi:hypothetical protein